MTLEQLDHCHQRSLEYIPRRLVLIESLPSDLKGLDDNLVLADQILHILHSVGESNLVLECPDSHNFDQHLNKTDCHNPRHWSVYSTKRTVDSHTQVCELSYVN